MKFLLILTIIVLVFVLFKKNSSISEENSKFYVDGQIHPAYSIKIVINGKLVEEVMPDKENVKIFVFDLDNNVINRGKNTVVVLYNVLRNIDKDVGSNLSFRFNIRYQSDIDNNETVEKLIKVKGPEAPFPSIGSSGDLSETFEFEI
jgi:hypothetical protein